MRLLYLSNAISVHTRKWVNYFAHAGHEVHLITWRRPGTPSGLLDSVHVHRIVCPPHYVMRYGALLEVMRIVRATRPGLVHAHYIAHFGIVGGLLARFTDSPPLVLTAWGSDVLGPMDLVKRRLIRMALQQADCVTCDSPHVLPRLAALGAKADSIQVINFGVDTELFRPDSMSRDLVSDLGFRPGPIVISLRSLKPIYDVGTLIRAIPLVLKEVPDAAFVIAGDGDQRQALQQQSVSLGVSENVRFVGMLPNDMLPDYLNGSCVYVSTSLSDAGIAASTAEAMACGLPAVVTDFGDNGNWVRDGETGYLFPCGDSDRLAERLILLLRDAHLRGRLGANGRREIVERNSYQVEMRKMERVYEELIARHGGQGSRRLS